MKQLLHNLIGFGPSSFARFMAGCSCEQPDTVEMTDFYIKKLVHTGVSPQSAQEQALWLVTKKNEANDSYRTQDELGLEGEGPQFSFTDDGDIRFSGYPETLHAMYKNQREKSPKQYNQEEHQTVLSAYQALRNGANQAAHIVHQYNEQGELDIRDVVVLTFDHRTNTGRMHVLNISQEGKNHTTLESARDSMQKRLGGFEEEMITEGVFLFIREEKSVDPVSLFCEKTNSHEIHERTILSLNDYRKEPAREISMVQPIQGAIPFMRTVKNADSDSPSIPFHLPLFLQRLMGRNEKGELKNPVISERPKQQPPIETRSLMSRIEIQKEKMEVKQREVFVAQKTGIGIGGAIHILESLTIPSTKLTKKEKGVLKRFVKEERQKEMKKKHIQKETRREKETQGKQKGELIEATVQRTKRHGEKETQRRKEERKMLHGEEAKKRKMKEQGKIPYFMKEKRIKEISRRNPKKQTLVGELQKISRRIRKERMRTQRSIEKKGKQFGKEGKQRAEIRNQIRRLILEFTQSWILFALMQSENKKEQGMKVKVGKHVPQKEEKRSHEESPWILLSIIWYMTMIREQGKVVLAGKKKKKKNTRKKKKQWMRPIKPSIENPPYGVIYAYRR